MNDATGQTDREKKRFQAPNILNEILSSYVVMLADLSSSSSSSCSVGPLSSSVSPTATRLDLLSVALAAASPNATEALAHSTPDTSAAAPAKSRSSSLPVVC